MKGPLTFLRFLRQVVHALNVMDVRDKRLFDSSVSLTAGAGSGSSTEVTGLGGVSALATKGCLSGGGVVAGKDKGVGGSALSIAVACDVLFWMSQPEEVSP